MGVGLDSDSVRFAFARAVGASIDGVGGVALEGETTLNSDEGDRAMFGTAVSKEVLS